MSEASIRDLRRHGRKLVDRAAVGDAVTIVRDGKPVAELRGVSSDALSAAELLKRWRTLPPVDPATLRTQLDAVLHC